MPADPLLPVLDRRRLLAGGAMALLAGACPQLAFARAATDRRFVFVIQRGAADGLATLAPTGDPAFAALRGAFADLDGGTPLGDFFTLHPALKQTAQLYAGGEALFVHATASPYRERSHFDGQNVLETGGRAAYALRDGWLNRLLGLLPPAQGKAIALSATVPMVLRGPREVSSYAPSGLPDASADLMARVGAMYAADSRLHALWTEAMATRDMAGDAAGRGGAQRGAQVGALVARMLAEDGARIAVVETQGWDTHAGQKGRLASTLGGVDAQLAALKAGLGPAWADTLVLVATEFGRTAAPNGTGGTDHGTGAVAWLAGGAVQGGRVVADWPGLRPADLFEGRDLRPTTGLDAVVTGALAAHFGLDPAHVARTLFPDGPPKPLEGLLRA
ncbi:MAG: DUF1501 domain-containing protein [Sphingomonadales bacterium]|nr:DUF1501 domain-containing protein [Sphingomonadales bacterium]